MHQHGHPALPGELLHLGPVALEVRHPHLLVVDVHRAQAPGHLAATADEIGRRLAAVEDGHVANGSRRRSCEAALPASSATLIAAPASRYWICRERRGRAVRACSRPWGPAPPAS